MEAPMTAQSFADAYAEYRRATLAFDRCPDLGDQHPRVVRLNTAMTNAFHSVVVAKISTEDDVTAAIQFSSNSDNADHWRAIAGKVIKYRASP
jgi:hypothetical protein